MAAYIQLTSFKGKIDKIVVVIKDKEQIALERYLFSVETMIDIEGFNKDTGYACSLLVHLSSWLSLFHLQS